MMSYQHQQIQHIGIIGAGASGLSSAKALIAERCFQSIEILEQRMKDGGVWDYTRETANIPVPSTDPSAVEEVVISEGKPVFISAMYDELETNIPKQLMNFDGYPFLNSLPVFPPHTAVKEYIREYGKDVQHLITFNAKVIECRKKGKKWEVLINNAQTGRFQAKRYYDAIIVAVGHYNIPHIPPVPGMEEWAKAYPGSISHSKNFRTANSYARKKVIVVGNAASGLDIAAQITRFSQHPTLQSCRSESGFATDSTQDEVRKVPEIKCFSVAERSVEFSDGSLERNVDYILYCTGYLHSLPFLSSVNEGKNPLIVDGSRVHNLYQHIFYIPDPTLSIIGLPVKVIPFQVAQAAAALVARVLAGRIILPSRVEMKNWELREINERGEGKRFHYMDFPRDADYIDQLEYMCQQAKDEGNSKIGLNAPKWGEKERWIRARTTRIKAAHLEMKKQGIVAYRLEELGFDFEKKIDGFKAANSHRIEKL